MPLLRVLGDVAMGQGRVARRNFPSGLPDHGTSTGPVGDVEQDVGGLAGTDQHDVPRDQVGLGHHLAGQHQEAVGAVQVERGGGASGFISLTNLVRIAALVADVAATS